jgi:hypothetical protein
VTPRTIAMMTTRTMKAMVTCPGYRGTVGAKRLHGSLSARACAATI